MLSDDELMRMRTLYFEAGYDIALEGDEDKVLAWAATLLDQTPADFRALLLEVYGTRWHARLREAFLEIGFAAAPEVLANVPLPLDDVPIRRWQLRRELARAVEAIDDAALQQLVYTARGLAPGALLEIDDLDLEEITAAIKLERALHRAESNERRHGTRVVATPNVVGGQVRIDGTRMPLAMLIIYLRSMTESEISREWAHLPPGWLDAIVAWIDGQRVSEGGE
jgi:uncharacterized protein (DUF433 family)